MASAINQQLSLFRCDVPTVDVEESKNRRKRRLLPIACSGWRDAGRRPAHESGMRSEIQASLDRVMFVFSDRMPLSTAQERGPASRPILLRLFDSST
jgi:hypothetical protein